MPATPVRIPYVCIRCRRKNRQLGAPLTVSIRHALSVRNFADSVPQPKEDHGTIRATHNGPVSKQAQVDEDEGAMTRRLRDMSEDAIDAGGRGSQKIVSEAGFSEELRKQLEERIASASFRAEHRSAFAEAELPTHVGRATRDIATADPWSGEESLHDTSLRMLNDAHKPLKFGRVASVATPRRVDTGRRSSSPNTGTRLASARDRSGLYSSLKDSELNEREREKRFQQLKDRFSPEARSVVPGTIQGLASLANERIENAIARGQFKNLPRGKKIERDYTASSPFLDTTEYFMNKIIQKQEIVPPWIEKQQELVATATKFRSRLRNDWKRHAARMIASQGGTLQEQMRRAEAFAEAEVSTNPPTKRTEMSSSMDDRGQLYENPIPEKPKIPYPSPNPHATTDRSVAERIAISADAVPAVPEDRTSQSVSVDVRTPPDLNPPAPHPFRDATWEANERAYHTLSINDLNGKTRSYNLQAPDLAKKPYFSLTRELNACYADVAPQLAEAIRERATMPRRKVEGFATAVAGGGGVLDRLVGGKVRVRDERLERRYGFREFLKDVWG